MNVMKTPRSFPLIAIAVLFWTVSAHAGFIYWNGETANSSYNTNSAWQPSGTWNNDASNLSWSTNDDEGSAQDTAPTSYPAASTFFYDTAVFANGIINQPYTVQVDDSFGPVTIINLRCDVGPLTLDGDLLEFSGLDFDSDLNLLSVSNGQVLTINCVLTNTPSNVSSTPDGSAFHKAQLGTLILGATNVLTGLIEIEGGVLALACDQSFTQTNALVLANGADFLDDDSSNTPATFNTGGHTQSLGPLTLMGPDITVPRTIDFSNGLGALSFADSSGMSWDTTALSNNTNNPGPIPLFLTNYIPGLTELRFGTNSAGLTASQLSQIVFLNQPNTTAIIDNNGYVIPVSAPAFVSLTIAGNVVQLLITNTVSNVTYEVDYADQLNSSPPSFAFLSTNVATGSSLTVTDAFTSSRFYTVKVNVNN